MKRIILILSVLGIASFLFYSFGLRKPNIINQVKGKTFHELEIKLLDEKSTLHMKDYKGKKILCVNVASECGYTPQYAGLQKLYETYKDKLVVIGFPCNQFGAQEPGSGSEIESFCKKNYGVTFPITEKIDVKGEKQHPVYQWLCQAANNGVKDVEVKWNFGKFLLDENGKLIEYFPSKTEPLSEAITQYLK